MGKINLKGKKYRVPVVRPFLEWTHSMHMVVEEIYTPELGIAFNQEGYVFKTNEKRYKPLKLLSERQISVELWMK